MCISTTILHFQSTLPGISLDGQRTSVKFYLYLVELILHKYHQFQDKIVVATKNGKVITNLEGSLAEVEMSGCSQPEAGSRILHALKNCIQTDLINAYVRTNNTM